MLTKKEKRIKYFNGDDLAATVWNDKYKLGDEDSKIEEDTPDNMHLRMATEFARVDSIYQSGELEKLINNPELKLSDYGINRNQLTVKGVYDLLKNFGKIVPQGSVMSQLGNDEQIGSLSNCFDGDTEVHTMMGDKKIKDVVLGDVVVTETGELRAVTQLHENELGNRRMVDLKVYKTPNIKVTENHKFLSLSKEQLDWGESVQENEVSNLRVGDYIAIPNQLDGFGTIEIDVYEIIGDSINFANKNYELSNKTDEQITYKTKSKIHKTVNRIWNVDEEFAYFLGLWYGDGCVFSNKTNKFYESENASYREGVRGITFTFNKNEEDVINFVKGYGESLFGFEPTINTVDNTLQIKFETSIIGVVFEKLFGAFSRNKKLTPLLNRCTTNIIKSLTQGLIDSDGTITKTGDVRVTLVNKKLIKSFYHLLRSRNIIVGYSESAQKTNFSDNVKTYRLDFTKYSEYVNNSNKFYKDNRKEFSKSKYSPLFVLEKDGYTLLRIQDKLILSEYNKEFVYTFGVGEGSGDIHSYSVEGLICFNCFVIGQPEDSYGGIMLKDQELVQLMKRRGGVGIDISSLRPNETPTSNAAKTSTGAVSFMERFSNSTREVAQNGRRGALMLSIDVRHPDVADFIRIKNDRTKVTGANISVSLRDDFMEAVKKDEDYILRWPIDADISGFTNRAASMDYDVLEEHMFYKKGSFPDTYTVWIKKIKAKKLYDLIIHNAWDNAEPGQIFIDRHWDYSPDGVYPQYRGITTNPCGEIFMQPYDACRLMALNFYSFVDKPFTKRAQINYDALYEASYEQQRLADNLVDLELEKITNIINKVKNDTESEISKAVELNLWKKIYDVAASGRRTGCGFTGLGDMIAAMGVDYDSEEGKNIITEVMKTKMRGELDCTIDLAALRGAFDGYSNELEYKDGVGINTFFKMLKKEFKPQYNRMISLGRRNVSFSTVAPTGSVSILTQTTSGLEPVFSVFPYLRRKKLNPNDVNARVDFIDEKGDQWQEFSVTHKPLIDFIRINNSNEHPIIMIYDKMGKSKMEEEELVEMVVDYINNNDTPYSNSSANDINWIERVKIQSIIQKYTTHSISSTINLPSSVTEKEVSEIYIKAWEMNLKGVTIYRDGCRTGVLVTKTKNTEDEIIFTNAPKRPEKLECEIYHPKVKGKTYTVVVGLLKGRPYEVFASDEEIGKGHQEAINRKVKSGHYSLLTRDGEDIIADNIGSNMTDEEEMFTRALSAALRHGMHVKYAVEICNNGKGDITSFTKVIARTLKRYIEDGEISTKKCLDCGATDSIIYEEGCQRCKICGSSKCS